jgi:hypothetical protein
MQNFHRLKWDHEILYDDRYSEDKQLLIRLLLSKTKNMNMVGGWNLKFTFSFSETTHGPLHLDNNGWYNGRWWTYLQPLFKSLFSLTELLNKAMVGFSNSWDGAKLASVNVGAWHIFTLTDLQKTINGRLNVKIHILLFYGENSWTAVLRETIFYSAKDHGNICKFYLNHYCFWRSFWIWRWFEILRLCWDKRWTTLRIIHQLSAKPYLCKLFISLLLNLIQLLSIVMITE